MQKPSAYPHIVRKAAMQQAEKTFSHPWNPASQITGTQLGRLAGLSRTGVSIARIAPGKESFAYHLHHTEEEWIFILSGTAVAHIDGQDYELEAGDFVAFPTPSVAHNLANRSGRELVYLMGGENHSNEVADFPGLDRRMVKLAGKVAIYRLSDGKGFDDAVD
jgi:uncharacterized cupin superfamily protein